jgi:hypothetical protein
LAFYLTFLLNYVFCYLMKFPHDCLLFYVFLFSFIYLADKMPFWSKFSIFFLVIISFFVFLELSDVKLFLLSIIFIFYACYSAKVKLFFDYFSFLRLLNIRSKQLLWWIYLFLFMSNLISWYLLLFYPPLRINANRDRVFNKLL